MASKSTAAATALVRPDRLPESPVPPIPEVDESRPDLANTTYSRYRTRLSNHRTGLSEHRTSLSEFRTDLSTHRTDLSTNRTEMSMRRTGMSFHRTRMSADRTLMSVIRTALSLIGFGFTIAQFFTKLHQADVLKSSTAPTNFGVSLVLLGIAMLAVGIGYHIAFMLGLRTTRGQLKEHGLLHADSQFPVSLTLMVAIVLLVIGFFAIASLLFDAGPFG